MLWDNAVLLNDTVAKNSADIIILQEQLKKTYMPYGNGELVSRVCDRGQTPLPYINYTGYKLFRCNG